MLPIILVIAGIGFLFVPTLEPVALVCWIGAFIGTRVDKERDDAYAAAEAVGYNMSKERRGDSMFDWFMAFMFLLPLIAYFFGEVGK